ncbi:hypothetical protein BFJ68_g8174 [Fusarium oxysporum]|uniref:Uncharacterized protein n=2 Tax=Fusarium oxysporum TaxID=5507 RepID=A0A420R4X2_FUSOX|nr:hypothetical protein BFJ68_g8174 [Fusarium oxysporum]
MPREIKNSKTTRKVLLIYMMFNMRNNRRPCAVATVGIAKVVGEVAESVDFEFLKLVEGHFIEEPVNDHAAFYSTLGVEDKDYFLLVIVEKGVFDEDIAFSYVLSCVEERALDKTLDEIEENAGTTNISTDDYVKSYFWDSRSVVNTNYWPMECS